MSYGHILASCSWSHGDESNASSSYGHYRPHSEGLIYRGSEFGTGRCLRGRRRGKATNQVFSVIEQFSGKSVCAKKAFFCRYERVYAVSERE